MEETKKQGLNSNQIKLVAIIAMTVDHLTWTFFPGYNTEWYVILLHVIGRLTAPIMWYFIAEGFHYTRNIKKYAIRLFALAVISHFAYNFCFGNSFIPFKNHTAFNQTGVVWSLAWGLVLLYISEKTDWKPWLKILFTILICVITFPSDWSCIATMSILYIGANRGNFKKQMLALMIWSFFYAAVYFFFINKVYAFIQLGTCLTIPILKIYNGQRGSWKGMGKLFYAYYPAHLVICGIVRIALYGFGFATGVGNI